MVQYLSAVGMMPEMIVVAIINTDRVRDLTPSHSTSWSNGELDIVLQNDNSSLQTSSLSLHN